MNKFVAIIIIVGLIVIAGLTWWSMSSSVNQPATSAAAQNLPPATDNIGYMDTSTTTTSTTTTVTTTSAAGSSSVLALSTTANDSGATPETFTVKAGTQVALTFTVDQTGVYHLGLDFKSPVVDSGTIASGQSGTVNFTATKSFSFTPYWPASNIKKNYTIDIIVQ